MKSKRIQILSNVILCLLLMCGCKAEKQASEVKEIPVRVINLTTYAVAEQNKYVGTVTSSIEAQLSFQVAGSVKKVFVSQGQMVKQGQLLAALESENLHHSNQAAQATLKQAADGYKRLKVLYDNGSLPEIKFVEIQTKLEQAQATASITALNLKDAKLYAPFDGVITVRNIEHGETVVPAIPKLTIAKLTPLEVKVAIPENEIGAIEIGQACTVSISAAQHADLTGSVKERNLVANSVSHTYEIKLVFDKEPSNVMPGMVCNVAIHSAKQIRPIVLPARVIQITPNGDRFVWCVEDGKSIRKEVVIGKLLPRGVEIISGLTRSDVVISDGNHKVYNNAKVNVV